MLRAHCPIRIVDEEQQKQFREAKPCSVPDTLFARAIDRSLRACFALLRFTDHIHVVYVRGSTSKVDV
jgi:polyribonucleotide nucleotidyltransferase